MSTYIKGGIEWRIHYSNAKVGSIIYTVLATVPSRDIVKSSIEVQKSIEKTVISMIVAFVLILFFFSLTLLQFSRLMIRAIVDPINELRATTTLLSRNDLTGHVPETALSLDMKVLLSAFSKLVIALRFGNDSYSRGNASKAKELYTDALNLFTITGNVKGLGASHNNLGAVAMAEGKFVDAEEHFNQSIKYCELAFSKAVSNEERERLTRTLSDRRGNLALLFIERTDLPNNFPIAFEMLERLLTTDKLTGYIKGCVVKQGTLGQYFLKQKEVSSAERIFNSALNFVRQRDNALFDGMENTVFFLFIVIL